MEFLLNFINPLKLILLTFSTISLFYIEKYWKKLLLITILTIVIPNPSFIYTCLNLLFPIILFLNEKEYKFSDLKYLILFIIILSPFQTAVSNNFSLNIIYANISLLTMQLLLCSEGMSSYLQK